MAEHGERFRPGPGQVGPPTGQPPLALPAPRSSRGRHLRRRRRSDQLRRAGIVVAVVAVIAVLAGLIQLARTIGPSGEAAAPTAPAAAPSPTTVRPSAQAPPGSGVFGNLALNWSFEQDLSGWTVIGEAEGGRQTGGRTSGSAARVDARGSGPIGLALADVRTGAKAGQRFVAAVWIRSNTPGTPVTLKLVSAPPDGKPAVSEAVTRTPKGTRWTKAVVAHEVTRDGSAVRFELTTTGRSLVVDEVTIREG